MPDQRDVAVLVGSLREGSWNRRAAEALATLAPSHLKFSFVDIAVSLYNQDLDTENPSEDWKRLRGDISPADAVLFATPEYNRSVPGVLKNAIDIASRPYGKGVLQGKPAAVMGVSVGQIGAFGANHHLRQMTAYLDMPTLGQPEMYLGPADKLFSDSGEILQPGTRELMTKFAAAFSDWIELMCGRSKSAERGR
ncbi:NAD(P)H-dependent oxidoreductase [Terricaulis sp.]|uniref:NADPH-dependent FMN reductase n=1 Tax=Terricaulis sp. TaxID=2768686 RepID=UPI002AC39346|nr:NAD(P)H-dependent oxidoreductase [Terricaulis sp.]MDZ4692826.1 NAD(P)H-dependent oxidoreductase [Terricaulis sp.]